MTHIHITGICGVGTSAIAIALQNAGFKISGSDKGFFPPISTKLKEAGIPFYAGWHVEKMTAEGDPDMLMIGGSGKASTNPEMLYAKEKGIPTYSYPQIIEKYFLKKNNIVCAGTWGKTTTSAMLSFVLWKAGLDPSYMFGALSLSQKESARIGTGDWSVLEGDEYTGSQFDPVAKFFHYHPTHLLLTSVSWDHADIYPSEDLYFSVFRSLVESMGENALILACNDNAGVKDIVHSKKNSRVLTYGKEKSDYEYSKVICSEKGITLVISHKGVDYALESSLLGRYNAENIVAAFSMAHSLGIGAEKIVASIKEFKGMKRRLEKRHEGDITVIDDIAHSPEKAKATLAEIRAIYKGKIFAIFEPNIGGRKIEVKEKYDEAFRDADEIIIPRLSLLKSESGVESLSGRDLTKIIAKTHKNAFSIQHDEELVRHLKNHAKKGDVIVFLGSHGWRGMIEETIKTLTI